MLTALLATVVGFFTLKSLAGFIARGVLALVGKGAVGAVKVAGTAGENVGDFAASKLSQGIASLRGKSKLSAKTKVTAMNGLAGNVEDFGVIVFGSEKKMVEVLAAKAVEAMQEELSTDEGRAKVAKRLAVLSQEESK